MAKFTKEQIEKAKEEFLAENVEAQCLSGAGNNGDILILKAKETGNGPLENASE
jgi:hypothetical protein